MNKWNKLRRQNLGTIPQEASSNLTAPETAPFRKREINKRTKPLNFKVSEEFYWQLKDLALKQKCLMVEVVERSLEFYKQYCSKNNLLSDKGREKIKQKPPVQKTNPLNQFWKVNFTCDKCYQKFERAIVFSPAPNLDQLNQYPTYCVDCKVEIEEPEFCSFWTETGPEKCPHLLFDKKKQLCRSHNRQVWKRFNQFLKDKSVSSTATWLTTWEQSGDWKYFWNLGEKNE
ncbi:hypothetical protein [endosymbiont GvMRE of Glomus versiforme]|uniref:hypothetical protein n=1 Tax=endosymbiont GvMRE of Glomus versiforme TaxID=2039283 RepID=UPI000ED9AB2D|nr:hypothetical protein [endosymbiont GvMRE of Glomus versiforme]RHZ35872.1 hypothetical protein GvMRE_Ic4g38 [endosymbiont GvMRE of Glomus versiforme]